MSESKTVPDECKKVISKRRLLKTFRELIAIDSESFHERDMADYLTGAFRSLGAEVTEDNAGRKLMKGLPSGTEYRPAGNLLVRLRGTVKADPVLFSAHMDTVSPGNGRHAVLKKSGKITSDGKTVLGADDAAALSVCLESVRAIVEKGIPHPDIEFLITSAEEPYAKGSRLADFSKIYSKTAYVFDLSGPVGKAATAAPGIISFTVTVYGKKAHAGFCPENGIHAILAAAGGISKMRMGRTGRETTVNIGVIEGGTAANIVPDKCTITGEIRSLMQQNAEDEAEHLRKIFTKEAEKIGAKAEFTFREEFRAYHIPDTHPVAVRFRKACRDLGLSGELIKTLGGSDNNILVDHGIDGIVVACGMNEAHTTKEYTTISELVKSAELALKLMTI